MQEAAPTGVTVLVMDEDAIRKAIRRIAHEIIERNDDAGRLVVAGIHTRGVEVARRIIEQIANVENVCPELGVVDVSMHRDDLATRGRLSALETTQLPLDLDGRALILVDDVLFTGRSCRAAMETILAYGRPACIQLAVLVDRGHRELPIRADYVGKNLPTSRDEKISVRFQSLDKVPDSVHIVKPCR